ncbi:DUF4089 domain-containing protein [Scytonema sp. NUACC26]|uniref:DUF4089 domain-containing protein n=1 Tax=Scytonema sp. NUACC26 TaxID=3140176 RepID=UPI0034DC3FFC
MEENDFEVGEYVEIVAMLLDLQLKDEYRDGVVANFERIMAIALVVNEFPLPEELEVSTEFHP